MVFVNHFDTGRFNQVKIEIWNMKFYKELDDQILCNNIFKYVIYTCIATIKLSKSPLGDIMCFTFKGTLCT